MPAPDAGAVEVDADIPLRENLGGWLRLALFAAVALLLPSWVFASAALHERMDLPMHAGGFLVAGMVGAVVVLALVPIPLLLLVAGVGLNAVQAWWARRRRPIDDLVDREAVMAGVAIRSRVVGGPAPRAAEPQHDLAPIEARVGAVAIDGALALTVGGVFGSVGLLLGGGDPTRMAIGAGVGAALGVLAVGGGQAAGIALAGQTLGKRVLRIRIVTEEGREVGVVDGVLLRWVAWAALAAVPVVGWLLSVGDLWALLTDPARQSLHDQLARTLVVRAPVPEARAAAPPAVPQPAGEPPTT